LVVLGTTESSVSKEPRATLLNLRLKAAIEADYREAV